MCSASVDPMPSRISTPNRSVNRRCSGAGSGSPADAHIRTRRERLGRHVARGQRGVERRHPEEQRRPGLLEPLAYDVRARPAGLQDGRRPDGEREEHRVADAVGEEHLRDRERRVVGGDAEHLGAVRLADVPDVRVPVHRRLGQAGGAGGVEPQRPRVVGGRRDVAVARPRPASVRLVPGVPGDPVGQVRAVPRPARTACSTSGEARDRLADGVGELRGGEHDPGAGVGHDLAELGAGEHRGDRHRDEPGPERAEDAGEHRDLVAHHEHHPVVAAQAQGAQAGGDDRDPVVELGVGQRLRGEHRGAVARAAGDVPGDEVLGGVEGPLVAIALTPAGSCSCRADRSRSAAAPPPARRRWAG